MKVRSPGLGPRVRVRPWAFDDHVVHLALADQAIVPHADEVEHWIETLVDASPHLRAIRTGALFPDAASRFVDAGFHVIDTLALLRIDLLRHDLDQGAAAVPTGTTNLRSRHHREAAAVDRAAFGDPWGNDARDLTEVRHATPLHHARARFVRAPSSRWTTSQRRLVAFAITGAAAGQGYLQRLAVVPDQQRTGHGRALVLDSLAWMRRRRLAQGVVNTAVANAPALALYESLGFRRLPDQLRVMQLDLDPAP